MDKNIVIKAEDISKQYRLGQIGTGTFSNDLKRWWYRRTNREDPFLMVGEENDRTKLGKSDYVWSLKDINFEIEKGKTVGIIGRNGAGKSTLLKILSQITAPTTGHIKIKGNVAALLEVGTGFHPDLTGRDNIFLNGAILGMQKKEIRNKFDEIVDFSGVERYIDTPVKRYSSGMYVRLAFAVAAHLEPEILIIDEVLAVGDVEFQKKCLGKMKDVAGHGKTVLFVSHNMSAISSLCTDCIYLSNGKIKAIGETTDIVNQYLTTEIDKKTVRHWNTNERPGDTIAKLDFVKIIDENNVQIQSSQIDKKVGIEFGYEILKSGYAPVPNVHIFTSRGEYVLVTSEKSSSKLVQTGKFKSIVWIPENLLNEGTYIIGVALSSLSPLIIHFYEQEVVAIEMIENINSRNNEFNQKIPGVIRPKLDWETNLI